MKKLIFTFMCVFIIGCSDKPTPKIKIDNELRQHLFFKCLEKVPPSPTTTHYNDWSEVIEACDSSAYYMAKKCVLNCD